MKFRRKYFKGLCPKCKKAKKLTFVGENEQIGIIWLRCHNCSQTHSFPIERVRKIGRVFTESELEKRKNVEMKVTKYSPEKTYWVGQKIHHTEFKDVGEIVKKEKTAGNKQIIVVKFEKKGTKKLVEGYDA